MITNILQVVKSIISHGCFLMECSVEHSIIGVRSRLECGVKLEVITLLMGESLQDCLNNLSFYLNNRCYHTIFLV